MIPLRARLMAVGLMVVIGVSISACGSASSSSTAPSSAAITSQPTDTTQPITIKVWDQATESGVLAAATSIYAAFMAAHPNITVEAEHYDFNSLNQLAKTAMGSGSGPDILYFDAGKGSAGQFADNGLIIPLTDYAAKYKWDTRIAPTYQRFTTYSGKLYALPDEAEFNAITVNDGLIQTAGLTVPTTFDDLLTFCTAAKAKGYVPLAYGQGPVIIGKDMFAMTLTNILGPEKVAALVFDQAGSWDTPEVAQAIDMFWVKMRDAGCFEDGINAVSLDNALSLFTSNKALMLPGGSFFNQDLASKMPGQELSLIPFPSVSGGAGRFYEVGLGGAWMISTSSKNPDAAAELLDFMYSDDSAKTWVQVGEVIPPVAVALDETKVSALTKQASGILGGDPSQLAYYIWPAWSNTLLNDVFNNGIQAVYSGDKTPETMATEMQAQWQKDLGQ